MKYILLIIPAILMAAGAMHISKDDVQDKYAGDD
jgi:hypothetical protein